MGKGIWLAGLSAVGNSVADIAKDNERRADEERMLKLRTDASVEMQSRIADAQAAREQAELEKVKGYLTDASTPVQAVAERVTAIDPDVSAEGYKSADGSGMPLEGNYEELKAKLMTAPNEDDRNAALELLDKRFANTQVEADKAVAGKMVAPAAGEAVQGAIQRAIAAGDVASALMLKKLVDTKAARYINSAEGIYDTHESQYVSRNPEKIAAEATREAGRLKAASDKEAARSKAAAEQEERRDKRRVELLKARILADGVRADRAADRIANKPLAQPVIKSLQETRDNAVSIHKLDTAFKEGYADKGFMGMMADSSMSAKAIFGFDKEAVEWWKTYKKQAELVERHAMFGASLTVGEQAAWKAADISPGMDPDVIKTNLTARAELAKTMLENTKADYIGAGYSEKRISLIVDRGLKQIGGAVTENKSDQTVGGVPGDIGDLLKLYGGKK